MTIGHKNLIKTLNESAARDRLINHPFLNRMRTKTLSKAQVEVILGQWFHPLHYFPDFLSRLISLTKTIEGKTFLSKILWQELGEGDPNNSHETIFIESMTSAGMNEACLTQSAMLPQTKQLLDDFYQFSHEDNVKALGCVFATEAADLAMVGAIGLAVRKMSGVSRLPWIDIHITQEPDHTDSVENTLLTKLDEKEMQVLEDTASKMFDSWSEFFNGIEQAIDSLDSYSHTA